jgi:hypothetical protein
VEPGSAEDVSIIVSYPDLTLQNWTSVSLASYFRINPNAFCCERWRACHECGIFINVLRTQIVLSCFNEIKVDFTSGTVEIGAGFTWYQVYANLELTGVNVVVARAPTVGVAGFTLGGGRYLSSSKSWISGRLFI